MKTYIIGHKKPDTDSVVAAIALEYLSKNSDGKNSFMNSNLGEFTAAISDPLNPETKYLFEKFNIKAPEVITASDIGPEDQVILVDHNEASQRIDGLNENQIVNIIDHHKINLNLNSPISLIFRPWGSTSTIIYHIMKNKNVTPTKELASLMLAAILSDTVGYKSATTTKKDREIGAELAQIAEVLDIDAFALEIFKAKSDISTLSDEQIVKNDYKVFEFGKKTMINQLETVEQELILSEKKAGLLKAMEAVKSELQVELLFVAITDVLQVNTKLLILSDAEKDVAQKAFGGTVIDSVLDIGPKMSRKKEIAPVIETALK